MNPHAKPSDAEPRWLNIFLILAAFICLATVVAVAWQGWTESQGHRHRQVADLTVNLAGQPAREHCTTCHARGALPHQPHAANHTEPAHPDISPHDISVLGCTGCHLGEGMAMDLVLSHGLPEGLGARQVLKGKELQASCYTCHLLAPLPGAEKAWQGFRLFLASACDSCHHISGLKGGGRYGPDLSQVGSQLGLDRIIEAIREPDADPPNTLMPRYPLSRSQTDKIAYFLKSRVADPKYATPMQLQAGQVGLPPWEEVLSDKFPPQSDPLRRSRCLACHQFGETDGRIAPDLTHIGLLRPPEYLRDFLDAPNQLVPGSAMPKMALGEGQMDEQVRFMSARTEYPAHHREPKHLYMDLCQRCHAAAGDGMGLIHKNLANFPRPFAGNATFFKGIADRRMVASVRDGIPGTSMPPYGRLLGDEGIDRVLDLIFAAFVGIPRTEKALPKTLPARPRRLLAEEATAALFAGHCADCHGPAGTGTGPRQLEFLPRPRNLTNTPYFASLGDTRIALAIVYGVPGTGMTAFAETLDGDRIWSLVAMIRTLSRTTATEEPR